MATVMRRGAVAMFDALGFKGIWRQHDADQVVGHLKKLQSVGAAIQGKFTSETKPWAQVYSGLTVSFISDTVVVAVSPNADPTGAMPAGVTPAQVDGGAICTVAMCVSKILYEGAAHDPALVYRGAISFGDFVVDDRFLVGEAIDDAAAHMDTASCGCVWLTPRASDVLKDAGPKLGPRRELVPVDVPLTGGDRITTHGVSPFVALASATNGITPEAWLARALGTFDRDRSARVRVLRQNTERFLTAAMSHDPK